MSEVWRLISIPAERADNDEHGKTDSSRGGGRVLCCAGVCTGSGGAVNAGSEEAVRVLRDEPDRQRHVRIGRVFAMDAKRHEGEGEQTGKGTDATRGWRR